MATELPQICGCHEMKDKTQLEKRQKIKKKEKTELEEETDRSSGPHLGIEYIFGPHRS
jgi:hypothetical protein